MSDRTPVFIATKPERKTRRGLWWGVVTAMLVLGLAAAAIVIVPRVLHAQRVAAYTEYAALSNAEIVETDHLRVTAEQSTVLYALQFDEAKEFLPQLEDLAGMSDHYFTDADRADLATSAEALATVLEDDGLTEEEAASVMAAKNAITTAGYFWQTDFLSLGVDAMEQLVDQVVSDPITPVLAEDVSQALVDEAEARLATEEGLRAQAESVLARVEERSATLADTVVAALQPLSASAISTPAQVEVVLGMYPNADSRVVELLRESSRLADASVNAQVFSQIDGVVVPVVGDIPTDRASFPVTDAWRAVIIATHLKEYSGAITGAWITDAGGVEAALGFNPYLPFF